jgi:hypothetical protein
MSPRLLVFLKLSQRWLRRLASFAIVAGIATSVVPAIVAAITASVVPAIVAAIAAPVVAGITAITAPVVAVIPGTRVPAVVPIATPGIGIITRVPGVSIAGIVIGVFAA